MVVWLQPFLLFDAIFLLKKYKMTLMVALNSNILNNKGTQTSFSVQILSTFTFPRQNPASFLHFPEYNLCWTKSLLCYGSDGQANKAAA